MWLFQFKSGITPMNCREFMEMIMKSIIMDQFEHSAVKGDDTIEEYLHRTKKYRNQILKKSVDPPSCNVNIGDKTIKNVNEKIFSFKLFVVARELTNTKKFKPEEFLPKSKSVLLLTKHLIAYIHPQFHPGFSLFFPNELFEKYNRKLNDEWQAKNVQKEDLKKNEKNEENTKRKLKIGLYKKNCKKM